MNEMKKIISKASTANIATLVLLLAASLTLQSCKANEHNDHTPADIAGARPDEALTKLARSLAEGDAPGFAALCTYPILRPYPLKDIEDSISMVDYFPILVDEPFRSMFRESKPDDWESYGWRGWSIAGSNPLWYDEGVQIIDYVSPAEAGLQRILAREEIMSLAPQFRDGWTPVMTLVETDGDRVFRIDSKAETFRLMGFDRAENIKGIPALLLLGTVETEGSAGIQRYTFTSAEGMEAEFMPDAPAPALFLKHPKSGGAETCNVRPAYWRDIIK